MSLDFVFIFINIQWVDVKANRTIQIFLLILLAMSTWAFFGWVMSANLKYVAFLDSIQTIFAHKLNVIWSEVQFLPFS